MKEPPKLFLREMVVPFALVASMFFAWGFANDVTNPMVKAFSKIFRMSVNDGALVQFAFYGGYFAMAFPAALFIRRFSYKAGILVGLGLYSLGALLFIPCAINGTYYPFLIGFQNIWGLYCLVGVSACMCGMFSTIYGIALSGLDDDAKFGSVVLIMAILGGSIIHPLQARIIDMGTVAGIPAVNASFILSLVYFTAIIIYGFRTYKIHERQFTY